ncbi:MAG: hypothetical protein JXO44_10010 [Clostridia bacterium]|nr:hypothetical protein [Clostridia bacterium]
MNKYRYLMRFFQAILWGSLVGLILMIVIPLVQYRMQPEHATEIAFRTNEEPSAMNWILKNEKILSVDEKQPNWIFVNDASQLDPQTMALVNDNIFIGEMLFSQFGGDVSKHYFIEQMFDIKYTGFIGKTCADLSDLDDVPRAMIDLYESKGQPWSYYGKGIILTNEEDIIVLVAGQDYEGTLSLQTELGTFPYSGYFEILEGDALADAQFSIAASEMGQEKLDAMGLPTTFGAAFSVENKLYNGIYYCGKFSEIPVDIPSNYSLMSRLMRHKGIYDDKLNESVYWKWYYPKTLALLESKGDIRYELSLDSEDDNSFYIDGQDIFMKTGDGDVAFFIKGVNLGSALPGKAFTEFPMDKGVYRAWFEQMAALNVNTVRVYTLLPPSFYQALYEFNENRDKPIYLLQEIWPEENPEAHNYLGDAYNQTYREEIEYAVHAIHGNINIPMRSYRAYGVYGYDVSPYLIGYLVGREMEPTEVQATDALNEGYAFEGRYLYTLRGATPTEAWLAGSCDYALKIEDTFYGDAPLVAIVSWPTLDPQSHESEWDPLTGKENKFNDNTVVDINHIGIHEENMSGFFGAYHIYPNYPDFMNNEVAYNDYEDTLGRFRYGGYLQEFMSGHEKYPAVVAEYGISTSQVTAHFSPDGYNHGGLSETDQSEGIVRMTQAIVREGYSGALIFEWMDEWSKKTWTTEPYMIPYNKNAFWHNALDPEQNYGLLAMEPLEPEYSTQGPVAFGQNEAYIYLKVDSKAFVSKNIRIAIDTVADEIGTEEFLLNLGGTSSITVNPSYNWLKGYYYPVPAAFDDYENLVQMTNAENTSMTGDVVSERTVNLSNMRYGTFDDPRNTVVYEGGFWNVRIPYGILGISDPTTKRVLYDSERKIPVAIDQIGTEEIEHIRLRLLENDRSYEFELGTWDMPRYTTREKRGFYDIAAYFETLSAK